MAKNDTPTAPIRVDPAEFEANDSPVTVACKGSKRVTFPDLMDMEPQVAEERISALEYALRTGKIGKLLDEWLDKEDRQLLNEAYPTYKAQLLVLGKVFEAYQQTWATAGEDSASES